MAVADWLRQAESTLEEAGVTTGRLDALVLLEDCLGRDKAYLLAHPELKLGTQQTAALNAQIVRRSKHVPLAYIRGFTEFYGREFIVDDHVLEPRPESETMIELLKKIVAASAASLAANLAIIDVGTGSGALAITAKLELHDTEVLAVDIDPNCLALASKNAKKMNADITLLEGNLLEPLLCRIAEDGNRPYALLCNLPYVPDNFHINQAAAHEPRLAIFGGPDGLDLYRQLFSQINGLPHKPRYVFTEALPPQHEELADIARPCGYVQKTRDDFIQVFIPG